MKQRRAFDQLTFPHRRLHRALHRATERDALVLLVQSLLLEILLSGIANTSSEESDDE